MHDPDQTVTWAQRVAAGRSKEEGMTNEQPTPDAIMQLGLAFWGSKALLSAVELGLFTTLAQGPLTGETLAAKLGLQPRGTIDWLDALVSLGMLERARGGYANTAATGLFLDRAKPSYLAGILEMANARLYPFWGSLAEALRTGQPQNEAKAGGDFFAALYQDHGRLSQFLHAMTGLSMGAALAIAQKLPWDRYHTVIDIGAAEGCVPVQLALCHPHLTGGGFDLPATGPIFEDYVASHGLASRLRFYPGDFFADPLPSADVLVMGHILHDWSLEEKLTPDPQEPRRAARRRGAHRLRRHHRRRPPGQHLRPAHERQHAHRNPGRLRLHLRRLPVMDG
jgi:hypothetical protein